MKKKYKYLFLSSIVIGNLVTSPVFALTGETATNETTVSETTPTVENLMEETTKIPSSEETTSSSTAEVPEGTNEVENSSSTTEDGENEQETATSSTSTDTSSTEISQTENNKETRDVTTDENWNYHISGNYAVLDSYVGSSTDIVVPNEIDGKQTMINLFSGFPTSTFSQNEITSIVFSNEEGKKCKLSDNYIRLQSCGSLQVFDGRGLDTSNLTTLSQTFYDLSNLRTINMAGWDTSNVTTMKSMFQNCYKLTTVDVSGWDTSNVTNMYNVFYFCKNLTSIDVSDWDTSNVTTMDSIFNSCYELTNIDVSKWNTSSVTNMTRVFNDCYKLTNIDVSKWNTENVSSFTSMFNECRSMDNININNFKFDKATNIDTIFRNCVLMPIIDLSKIKLPSNISMKGMFSSTNILPLLVKATDPKLLNYDYASNNRVPIGGPSFNANGGHFSDNSDTKYYFEKCALEPTDPKFQLSTFNNYKNTVEKPIKDGSLFHEWKLTSGTEPTTNDDLLKSDIVYSAQWTPSLVNGNIPSQDVDNVKPGTTSIYGIAYMPKAFTIPSTKLTDETTQTIPINLTNSYHVAVRDQRMTQGGWTLQAQLVWDNNALKGSYIQTNNGKGEVKKNTNTGSADFQLNDLIGNDETVTGEANVKIGTTPTPIMTGQNVSHNGVYDYDLGQLSLVLENANTIQAGTYTGNINWNLTSAP